MLHPYLTSWVVNIYYQTTAFEVVLKALEILTYQTKV